jgi:hypothetical protein
MTDRNLTYTVDDEPDPELIGQVVRGLVAYNRAQVESEDRQPLGAFVREGAQIVGGVDG